MPADMSDTTVKPDDRAEKARRPKVACAKRPATKREHLIRMLKRKAGADVATLSASLGWQVHTTRAELSRLRKAGYELARDGGTNGKPLRYRIVAGPTAGDAA